MISSVLVDLGMLLVQNIPQLLKSAQDAAFLLFLFCPADDGKFAPLHP
jgi:hypothetical protein